MILTLTASKECFGDPGLHLGAHGLKLLDPRFHSLVSLDLSLACGAEGDECSRVHAKDLKNGAQALDLQHFKKTLHRALRELWNATACASAIIATNDLLVTNQAICGLELCLRGQKA